MADHELDKADLEDQRRHIEDELRSLAPSFASRGLYVLRVEINVDNGRPFPDLLITLRSDAVEGRRQARRYMGVRGVLEDPSEMARNFYIWSHEVTRSQLSRLPRLGNDA